ncbi:MAG: response regulator [Bacteroidales bacterium]
MNNIRIVLVDDYKFIREILKILLANLPDIKVIGEAANANELFTLLKNVKPDILLMDISMPSMSGIAITEKISIEYPDVKVIMLTAIENNEKIFDSFRVGALGYLPKDIEQEELVFAIQTVYNGNEYIGKSISNTYLANQLKI